LIHFAPALRAMGVGTRGTRAPPVSRGFAARSALNVDTGRLD
jgi:hypothetical protein